jgi:hypothetical protein
MMATGIHLYSNISTLDPNQSAGIWHMLIITPLNSKQVYSLITILAENNGNKTHPV